MVKELTIIIDSKTFVRDKLQVIDKLIAGLDKDISDYRKTASSQASKKVEIQHNDHVKTIRNEFVEIKKHIANIGNFEKEKITALLKIFSDKTDKFKNINKIRFKDIYNIDSKDDNINVQQFAQTMMMSDNTQYLQDINMHLEERQMQILELERNVLEIFDLFKDMAVLIDIQGEHLNVVEKHVEKAKNNVEKGEYELQTAADYQKKLRKSQCCCLICMVIVLVIFCVIFFPVMFLKSS